MPTIPRYSETRRGVELTERENEIVVEKIFEAWNRRDFEAYMSHLSDDAKIVWPTGRTVDKETFHRELSTKIMPVFPDGISRIDRMISQGNTVCVEWTFMGTHSKDFFGIPATNKKIEFPEVYIYDFEAGKVKLLKVHVNQLRVLKQIKEDARVS